MWGQKRAAVAGSRAGLMINDALIAAASVEALEAGHDIRKLTVSAISRENDADVDLHTLGGNIGDVNLNRATLTSVLPSGSYQLLLVELPNVPAEEIKAAVRWQIKDLLDFPVDEAIIELFDIPERSNSGKSLMAYAIATRRSTLQQHVDDIHEAGLNLGAIDIPELCVRNVTALLPQDADGVALLHFSENRGLLTITRQGLLYVTRYIDIGWRALNDASGGALSAEDRLSAVVLEVQRSLDYYESHYDRRPITELVLDPMGSLGRLPELLNEQVGLTVSPLELSKYFELQADIPTEHQSACLFAIGAALRTEVLTA